MIGKQYEINLALDQRAQIINTSCHYDLKQQNMEAVHFVLEISSKAGQIQDPLKKNFIQDLLIGGTRDWESFEVIDGKPRFNVEPPKTLESNSSLVMKINEFPDSQLCEYQNEDEIQMAKDKILNNLGIMSMIAGEEISQDDVEMFFKTTKFYQYYYHNAQNRPQLTGLSAYDGQRTYINMYSKSRIRTIIHEIAYNISIDNFIYFFINFRFKLKVKNIRKINPEVNKNLKYQSKMFEAGNWIEHKLFDEALTGVDFFSLRIQQ